MFRSSSSQVIGLDLSATSTGVWTDEGGFTISPTHKGVRRLKFIQDCVREVITDQDIGLMVIEAYATYVQRSVKIIHSLCEIGGVVKLLAYNHNIPYMEVPPSVLKQFGAGHGHAKKEAMMKASRKVGFNPVNFDEADASFLYLIGRMKNRTDTRTPEFNKLSAKCRYFVDHIAF